MENQQTQGGNPRPNAVVSVRGSFLPPSSSRMVAGFLMDIEQLLDERRWDTALREACDLPRIAVALTDPQLRSSAEHVRTWCREWIRTPDADPRKPGVQSERARKVSERIAQQSAPEESVPTRALRRLRMSRHVRSAPRGFSPERAENLGPQESGAVEMCTALLEAARRWYARSACRDSTVQANLARLAVLR
jgi:hypothetical protein